MCTYKEIFAYVHDPPSLTLLVDRHKLDIPDSNDQIIAIITAVEDNIYPLKFYVEPKATKPVPICVSPNR